MISLCRKTFTLSEIKRQRNDYLLEWHDSINNRYTSTRLGFITVRDKFSGRVIGFSRRVSFSSYVVL